MCDDGVSPDYPPGDTNQDNEAPLSGDAPTDQTGPWKEDHH